MLEERRFDRAAVNPPFSGQACYEFRCPSDALGPGSTAFTVMAVPTVVSASFPRYGELRRLRHPVMNRLDGNPEGGLA